ncbi:hypothetical protein [Nocardioides psychrotolerans]|uniref:Uncharacterized protein n=1 Tax=Nocardioides psychrotolerans TaxID=1005945 RepID=A0A1I3N3T1_9ACTN|nr:hypothetical protein [Nocardioides psychrotolerans]SFJ03948.1 hypothetical protein SAMN05216561_1179 [Nocardioides psychrotolerans]
MIVLLWAVMGLLAWSALALPLAVVVGRALRTSGTPGGGAPEAAPGFMLAA